MIPNAAGTSHRIAQSLRQAILQGEYASGHRLPTEQALCERFGVSRVTVREGLRMLQDQALIHRRQGSGSYVNALPQRHIPLVHGGYFQSVRPYLDELERRIEAWRWVEADEPAATALQVEPGQSVLWAQRVDLLNGEPVAVDELWLEGSMATRVTRDDLERLDFLDQWQARQQMAVEYVRQTVEAVGASTPVARLLHIRRGKPALRETTRRHRTYRRAC